MNSKIIEIVIYVENLNHHNRFSVKSQIWRSLHDKSNFFLTLHIEINLESCT